MEKDIKEDLIQLSITNLIQCLEENNVKDDFIKKIKKDDYSKIVQLMREESTIIQMRDFHNWIKSILITNITDYYYSIKKSQRVSLLDIAVGRGGDLMKWNKAYITDVFGFDLNKDSIYSKNPENPGAIERLRNLKNYKVNVHFEVGDVTDPKEIEVSIKKYLTKNNLKTGFDLVSCQFALHYFFSSENALRTMLYFVSKNLKSGGYFFGTSINGDKIRSYFEGYKGNKGVFKRNIYKIEKNFPSRLKSPFGNKYTFTIYDNKDKTNYFNTIPVSNEFLTDFKILNLIAKQYSLEPVNINFFEKYNTNYTLNHNVPENVISFEDIYRLGNWTPKDKQLTPEQLELSFLNSVFIFRKN